MTPVDNKECPKKANVTGDKKTKFSVSNWTKYSNMKAMAENAGEEGHIFEGKYRPFTTRGIMRMIGTYIMDGLAPSPRLEWKMVPQTKNVTHGNDFIASCFGTCYQQEYRSFRHFFGCQNPLTVPPKKEECLNYKVDELFRWARYIWKEAWELGENISVDEQTCSMQGW